MTPTSMKAPQFILGLLSSIATHDSLKMQKPRSSVGAFAKLVYGKLFVHLECAKRKVFQ